jgi:hypothetical protein
MTPGSALEQMAARIAGEELGAEPVTTDAYLTEVFTAVAERLGRELGADFAPKGEPTVATIARAAADQIRPPGRAEALAEMWLFGDDMSEIEREIRQRTGGCSVRAR